MKIPAKTVRCRTFVPALTVLPGLTTCFVSAAAGPQKVSQSSLDSVVEFVRTENAKSGKVSNKSTMQRCIEYHTLVRTINFGEETCNAVLDAVTDDIAIE